jgi:YidC/Oxa1 family membrane protein insertase
MEDQGKRLILAVVLAGAILVLWQFVFPAPKKPPPKPGAGSAQVAQPQTGSPVSGSPVSQPGQAGSAQAGSPVTGSPVNSGSPVAAGSGAAGSPVTAGSGSGSGSGSAVAAGSGSGSGSAVAAGSGSGSGSAAGSGSGSGSASGSAVAAGSGSGSGSGAAPAGSGSGSAGPAPAPAQAEPVGPIAHKRDPKDELVLDSKESQVTFTKWGGDLVSWQLHDPRYKTTQDKGEMVQGAALGGTEFHVDFVHSTSTFHIPADAAWKGTSQGNVVTYAYDSPNLIVTKKYTVDPGHYLLRLDVDVSLKNTAPGVPPAGASEQPAITMFGYQDPRKPIANVGRVKREWKAVCLANSSTSTMSAKDLTVGKQVMGTIGWAGVEHPYFLVAIAPKPSQNESPTCYQSPVPKKPGLMQVDLVFTQATGLKPGDPPVSRSVVAYVGPKYLGSLEHADDFAGFKTEFSKSVSMGWFGFIGKPLLWLLKQFQSLVGNWGLSIILLTLLVKLITLYWTTKSMRSMRAMAALKPQMDALQKKYKDDRQRQQTELMALYKQHGVNPLAGCLPMLLQMPIWFALYRMLSSAGELYNAPFIPGWINDLTAKDPLYILPVLLVAMMFLQSKLQPQTGDSMQQKLMMYGLPLLFGVMGFFFPAGLTLYILTNTILTAIHSVWMRRFDKKSGIGAAVATAAAGAARGGGKGASVPEAKVVSRARTEDEDEEEAADEGEASDDEAGENEDGDEPEARPRASSKAGARRPQQTRNKPRRGQRRRGRN